ncbi:amidase [Aspergillus ibericus CBS 121593]|uniref:amidase n=1 Tax=Aspergillus ibericus CBS 121593 TaxID=1448316 RepID=A0A395HE34_9EURO|nr:amidase [Aspergillus ibericus CBS 121593]RAL06112.1 amidase [Aspergillus ibericus CBS 121593]
MMTKRPFWDLVARKRRECQEKIPSEWTLSRDLLAVPPHLLEYDLPRRSGILSEDELDLTENFSATQLLAKLASGQVSSLEVTTAFCKRATIAQVALDRARFLDAYLAREGKPIGPLHGLPISIKDSFCVEGVQSTVGYVSFLRRPPETKNSALVELLLHLGTVLYVKTNLPQTAMTADSENNIFGRTLNPHNTSLTAGGSSGGEGALVAFRGSILGVGTDVAGSIRIPSLCCGTYGFKPTANRVPYGGQVQVSMKGLPGLTAAAGPLAHSIEDLQLFMKVTVGDGQAWEYDETAVGVPWSFDAQIANKRNGSLNIGVLSEDKHFPLHPPVKRALERAIAALTRDGHRIIRINNQDKDELSVAYASRLAYQYFTYGPRASMDLIKTSGEPLVKSVARFDNPLFSGPLPVDQEMEPFQKIGQLHIARQRVSDAWRQVWVEQKLDAILAPGAQNTAVGHDTYGWPPYTVIWNLLDYPACIIPFGKVSKEQDPEIMITGDDVQPDYHPDEVDGAPCAIQVITPRFQDEKCLWAADIIDRSIHA